MNPIFMKKGLDDDDHSNGVQDEENIGISFLHDYRIILWT